MEAVNYFLGLVLMFAGLIVGMILAFIAKEELKPGKKYISLFQKFLLAGIFIIAVVFSPHLALKIVFAGILIHLLMFRFSFNDILSYGVFGFIFFIFAGRLNLVILLSGLIFLHGLPVGSLIVEDRTKENYKTVLRNIIYRYVWIIIVGMALYVVI